MTNPNNAIGTNAGFGGRTSPNAFNDILSLFDIPGVVSGWECTPKSGMTVQIGGGDARDVAIAEDNAGNRTTVNNRSGAPIDITLPGAPTTGNRYDVIIGYVANPASSSSTDVDYANASGIIVVSGTAASSPRYPSDADIRTAITADGADGTTAYYVHLCSILVGQGVTTIGSGAIEGATTATTSLIDTTPIDDLRNEIVAQRETIFEGNTQGDITITRTFSDFDEIEVTFASNSSGTQNAQKMILDSACENFTLETVVAGSSNTVYYGYKRYAVSGTNLTVSYSYQKSVAASAVSTQASTDVIHVLKIVGIKRIAA